MLTEITDALGGHEFRECELSGQIVVTGKLVDYWITACYKGFYRVAVVHHLYHDVNNLSFSCVGELVKFIEQKERCTK